MVVLSQTYSPDYPTRYCEVVLVFDRFAAFFGWIRISFQAASLIGSILPAYASPGVKIPWIECVALTR